MADLTEFYPAATFGAGSTPSQPSQGPMPVPGSPGSSPMGGSGAGFNFSTGVTTDHLNIATVFVILAVAFVLLHLE